MVEFTFKTFTFVVKRDNSGNIVYRDKAHLGGPWSSANKTLDGRYSFHPSFVKGLRESVKKLGG